MVADSSHTPRLTVYVSYCGADDEFAGKLIRNLQVDGRFNVCVDPDASDQEADWKRSVDTLIADADAVIVVLSPDSIQSCVWELDCALQYSKRIVPIVCRSLGSSPVPAQLNGHKIIRFGASNQFQQPFRGVLNRLSANADWVREHSRLLSHARMWDAASRPNNLLLTGDEAIAAKMWTLSRPDGAPKPTDLHIAFICMCEAVTNARASALCALEAEREEMETLALMQSHGDGLSRFAKQAYMVVGCWLAALALFSDWRTADAMKQVAEARSVSLQSCERPAAIHTPAVAMLGSVGKSSKCPILSEDN